MNEKKMSFLEYIKSEEFKEKLRKAKEEYQKKHPQKVNSKPQI